ncbi:MAG TPA: serine/threonine-protein kinase [Kofleriaceae bacterium]|nr:serine/threonine-protein kinase [Kofleriaceae bacterium]
MVDVSPEPTPGISRDGAARLGSMVSAYRIERTLGSGGMGWVYRARHVIENRVAALKVLRHDQLACERARDRMMREAAILATVCHAGIPELYECGLLRDGRPWIAMELVDGTPLAARMLEGPFAASQVVDLVAAIADVLATAHDRGITHRDLKPENVLLVPDDPRFPVRVIDWGIALHRTGARYTSHDEAIGTPTYMAPEQARGGPTEGFSDVYGLGVLAYQMLVGRPPFVGGNSVEILVQHLRKPVPPLAPRCPDAPAGLVALVERMLAKNSEDRPTARGVRAALGDLRGVGAAYAVYAVDGAAEGTGPISLVRYDD